MLTAHRIRENHADLFTFVKGNLAASATACHRPEETGDRSLVYASEPTHVTLDPCQNAAILVVHRKLLPLLEFDGAWTGCLFSVASIPPAMAALLKYFDRKEQRFTQWGAHHPTALIHDTATIGANVVLGPFCVIGAHSRIDDDSLIGSHTVIEDHVHVGARSKIHPHVFVGSACKIGMDCEIHPHTTIGSDGFGYASGSQGRHLKIPQLGNVVVGDGVEIGSNCAIDRATLESTHIRAGAKLDNLCHIAHNCDLGENGLYTAGFMMAGSTKIGKQFMTGGNTVVSAHLTIADNVALSGRSSVTKSITEAGAYGGYPLQPLQDALRTAVHISRLTKLSRDVKRVLNHLNMSSEDSA